MGTTIMKRAILPIAAVVLLAVAAAAAETMYARFSTPIRAERTLGAATVGTLRQGDAVRVLAREGRYLQISHGGRTGWVYFNKLAEEKPEDVAALLGSGVTAIELTELESGGALRGLSPMAQDYAESADVPEWAVKAVEEMQGRAVTPEELDEFQLEGGLGEFAGGGAP